MNALDTLRFLGAALVPPRCSLCRGACEPAELVCGGCARTISRLQAGRDVVSGVSAVTWAAPYEGTARGLVTALKFERRLGLAEIAGDAVALAAAGRLGGADWTVVPVPAAPLRRRMRGFDPAERIAAAVARRLGLALAQPLARANGPRQVGRPRSERLASRPRVRVVAPPPPRVLLVDDVLTTGATLDSCAAALRGAGCTEVHAAVFARTLGSACAPA